MKISKSQVFTIAHQIRKYFSNFSQALKAAWRIVKIYAGRPTLIQFAKSSSELRKAKAIAAGSLKTITKGYVRFVELVENGLTQWRSFKIANLVF